MTMGTWLALGGLALTALVIYDLTQKRHAILRNFPIIGHLRYLLEAFGPELRQYIVTGNDEERPFSRDQRAWVYTSAKRLNNTFGFGTDNDLEASPNYLIIKHAALPPAPPPNFAGAAHDYPLPCAKVLGAARGRRLAFRPSSVVNLSGMSFGSLSAPAVQAMNRGAALAGCLQNTGEGGISDHHRLGAGLVYNFGTGYFGCRDAQGRFHLERFKDTVASAAVRMIEIKLSQGAKPGVGGLLPGPKVSAEIARVRGIPVGVDCVSPSFHTAFQDVDSLLDFVELLADETGLPVGIKSAVGQMDFWEQLADLMADGRRGVDFITLDGGEGGTGAAPLVFSDHVSLPFKIGFTRVYKVMAAAGLQERVAFVGSGKLGFPAAALTAFALGADLVAVAREAMLAIGCIQAQQCHSGHCPTGVATQNRWLIRGLDPTDKAARLANYLIALRQELLKLCHACGVSHPALLTADHLEILDDRFGSSSLREHFGYAPGWGLPAEADRQAIGQLMAGG